MADDLSEQLSPEQRLAREAIEAAFRDVFATAAGKRVLYWMLEQCAIYRDAFTGEDNATNYLLGQQASGRKLIAMLDLIDPTFYPSLLLAVAEFRKADKAAAKMLADRDAELDDDDIA
jgi:hypothetical protein